VTKPFDSTLKHMLEHHPADCARLVGVQTAARIEVIDADLATVMAEADKVLRFDEARPWLMHFEFQRATKPIFLSGC
jgi:predicted transposase YdaD